MTGRRTRRSAALDKVRARSRVTRFVPPAIAQGLSLIRRNPGLLFTKIMGRLVPYLPAPRSPARLEFGGVCFDIDTQFYPPMKTMYYGCYAPAIVQYMRAFLRPGDTVLDIGANVGYLSAIAASLVGKGGSVHSFEPAPDVFQRLEQFAVANAEFDITVNCCAIGDVPGHAKLNVTRHPHVAGNTLVDGLVSDASIETAIEVPVLRLDTYIREQSIDRIALIKIDTEGFEFPVLKGLSGYLEVSDNRPTIICEVIPTSHLLLQHSLYDFCVYMEEYGYHAFRLGEAGVELDILGLRQATDVLFLPK